MQITVTRRTLLEKLGIAKSGITGRSTLPILSHILLTSASDTLTILGTDLEMFVSTKMELPSMSEDGGICIPLVKLMEVLSGLSSIDVTLKTEKDGKVLVSGGKYKTTLHTLPADEFPKSAKVLEKACFDISGTELKAALKEAVVAVSDDQNRAILTGVLLVMEEPSILLVATDTHRLVTTRRTPSMMSGEPINAILPSRFINELIKLMGEEEAVSVEVGEFHTRVTIGDTVLVSKVINGMFPNYKRVIPSGKDLEWTFQISELMPAVKRASIVARENSQRIIFTQYAGFITLSAQSQQVGECSEEVYAAIDGDISPAETFQIAYNAKYFLDMLQSMPGDKAILGLTGNLKPGLVRVDDTDNYQHVLMPMQVV
jgi:DNA polymerase-3 subunit beta